MGVGRVCFVTFELAPFTAGGIGTYMHNALRVLGELDVEIHVLFVSAVTLDEVAFHALFPNVFVHPLNPDTYEDAERSLHAPSRQFLESRFQWYSHITMRALRRLAEEHGPFDLIEFPDWGGFAFYSTQAKLFGQAFSKTTLAVRLHATDSLLRSYEVRPLGYENLLLADMERKALADADIVVGHLESTVEEYIKRYGFNNLWRRKVIVQTPPVAVGRPAARTLHPDPTRTPILFTSKLQSIKRPELFMRGVCDFALANPKYLGDIVVTAYDFVTEYGDRIRRLVPAPLKDRVRFIPGLAKEVREELISRSVVVLPNAFEAFCYAAYEASLLGAVVLLNGDNVSFGDHTPWVHGENCYKFSGTASSLSTALQEIFFPLETNTVLRPVRIENNAAPYWESLPQRSCCERSHDAPAASQISVLIPHRDAPNELRCLVLDLLEEQNVPLEIIIADNASENPRAADTLSRLQEAAGAENVDVKVRRVPVQLPCSALLNQALGGVTSPYVALLHPGMRVKPGFLRESVEALSRMSAYDVVSPTAEVLGAPDSGSPVVGFFNPIGEALAVGMHLNRSCLHAFVMRTDLLVRLRFNEEMLSEPEWEVLMRAVSEGVRCIVTPDAGVAVPADLAGALAWRSESERRANAEIVRRVFYADTAAGRIPLHGLGDAELVFTQWFNGHTHASIPISTHNETEHWRLKYEELRSAESVRVALAIASRLKKMMPTVSHFVRDMLFRKST